MSRTAFLLLALAALSQAPRACAGPMTLTVQGTAFGVSVNDSLDVTNGFSGLNLPLASPPLALLPGFTEPAVGAGSSLGSSFNLEASLTLNGASVSTLLSGPIQISFNRPGAASDLDGTATGSASVGALDIPVGLDQATIPAWFQGLSVQISGNVTGGSMNLIQTSLTVTPGPSQVPEPSTFAVLLIGMTALRKWVNRSQRA